MSRVLLEIPPEVVERLGRLWCKQLEVLEEIRASLKCSRPTAYRVLRAFCASRRVFTFTSTSGRARVWLTLVQDLPPTAEMMAHRTWEGIPVEWRRRHALLPSLSDEDRATAMLEAALAYDGDAAARERLNAYLLRPRRKTTKLPPPPRGRANPLDVWIWGDAADREANRED